MHFGGVDDLLAERSADELADALDELVRTTQRVAGEHGVTFLETDIDSDGGKLILVAGAPQTEGEDEERILRTARGIADAYDALPLRMGVSRGRVFAGEVGAEFRRTYTILGKTAAVAARLMGKAQPGQVLTTADVLERSRSAFETAELEPFELKGIPDPVTALDVLAVASGTQAAAERQLPFVGRERELAILSAAVGPVRMGFGNIVELIGDPGMGKSRLVEELQAQAPDLLTINAACAQYEASTPYFAFRGLLRGLLELPQNGAAPSKLRERIEELDPELVPWLPLVALPLDVHVEPTQEVEELQPAFRRARLHGVVETLLARLLTEPTLVVIEDVHWMDDASADLLRHLGRQAPTKPWLLCATRRPTKGGFSAAESVPPIPAMTIQLQPLEAEAARELVGAAATEGLLQHEVAAITDRAGGNPLFLQELVGSSQAPRGRGASGERRGRRRDAGRQASARRPRAAALRGRAGRDVQRGARDRGARGRPRRLDRRGGLGPARRVRRARSVHGRRVPLPACPLPGRRLRGPLLPPPRRAAREGRRGLRAPRTAPGRSRRAALAALLPRRRRREDIPLLARRG